NLSQDAPTQFVPMGDTLHSSDVGATLDPRVDPESDISFTEPVPEEPGTTDTAEPPLPADAAIPGTSPASAEPSAMADAPVPGDSRPRTDPPAASAGDQNDDGADGQYDAKPIDHR